MSIMAPGTYKATVQGLSPYQRKGGQMSVAIKVATEEGKEIIARLNIELNDGSLSETVLKNLTEVFPAWDKTVEGLFVPETFVGAECSIVVEDHEYEGKVYSEVKWFNAPSKGMDLPDQNISAKEAAAKYGAKFRALMGGAPAKAPAKTPPAKKAPPAPKKDKPVVQTMETCWEECQKRHGKDAEAKWTKAIETQAGGKEYDQITSEEWANVFEELIQPF